MHETMGVQGMGQSLSQQVRGLRQKVKGSDKAPPERGRNEVRQEGRKDQGFPGGGTRASKAACERL